MTDFPTPPSSRTEALFAEALAAHREGRADRARDGYRRVLDLQPDHAEALGMLGVAQLNLGAPAAAIEPLRRAVAQKPDEPWLRSNLGLALQGVGRFDEAVACYDAAIGLEPDQASSHFNRANALREWGRPAEAVAAYDRAIGLDPGLVQAHVNRGNALQDLGRPEEALADYERAIALKPEGAQFHFNRANALHDLGRFQEAIAGFDQAIALEGGYAEAHWNRALTLLLTGDMEAGWPAHEWRRRQPKLAATMRALPRAPWLGEGSLEGKRVLLHAEQGMGDAIQFCRYAKLVSALGGHVILSAADPLIGVMATLEGADELAPHSAPLPPFDRHCPLMSLPLAFGTTLASVPSPGPYLKADPKKVELWADRLGERKGPRVGLVWSGNPGSFIDATRSIALAQVCARLPDGVDYVCLQKDVRAADRPALEADGRIVDLSDEIADFSDTAALCALMDVVIAVDTAPVHLAGALGRPTWLLLRHASDWRWLLEREDSPWYGSVRIFRQDAPGDWDGVLRRVASELTALQGEG